MESLPVCKGVQSPPGDQTERGFGVEGVRALVGGDQDLLEPVIQRLNLQHVILGEDHSPNFVLPHFSRMF